MKELRFSNFQGFTLMGVLVALVIVTMCGLALLQLFSSQSSLFFSLDKKDKAIQIANSTIGNLNNQDYNSLIILCQNKNVLNVAQPAKGSCSDNQDNLSSSPSGSADLNSNPYQLEVLRDWAGNNKPNGEVCLELAQCKTLADNHLVDVTLKIFFKTSAEKTKSQTAIFRRTRW